MSAINAMETRIDEILKGREIRKAQAIQAMHAIGGQMEATKRQMEKAAAAGDMDQYADLKTQIQKLETEMEGRKIQLDTIEQGQLIDKTEYEAMASAVLEEVREATEEEKKALLDLADRAEEIAKRNSAMINRANVLLKEWQSRLYLDKDREYTRPDGSTFVMVGREKAFKDYSVYSFAREISRNSFVRLFREGGK